MKKKSRLINLAMLGIQMGLLFNGCTAKGSEEELNPEMRMFYDMLDPKAQKQFLELDEEHKRAAMSVINQYCKAMHECKGIRERAVQEQYDDQMRQGN